MVDIDTLCAFGGHKLTEEQKDICNNMDKSMLVMANPGTGKTTTLRYGIVMASRAFNIRADKILCMTFTRDARNELYSRYQDLCKKLLITPAIECSTFHSFCYKILKDTLPDIEVVQEIDMYTLLGNIVKRLNLPIKKTELFLLLKCIEYTSVRAITDESKLVTLSCYNELIDATGITYDEYSNIVSGVFNTKLFRKTILQGDIPQFALYGALNTPGYLENLREKYDLVIVDEFQDMNFIYMIIISKFAKKLIAVGDIKQQIYRFNGSSDNIIELYQKSYPNAEYKVLSQSFRCSVEIAGYASNIIRFNNYKNFDKFLGVSNPNSKVTLIKQETFNAALDQLVDSIKKDNDFFNHMFLYRYQQTGILLLDKLFSSKIPIIINYTPLYKTEFIQDIHLIYNAAMHPADYELWQQLYNKTIFKPINKAPGVIEEAKKQGTDMFTVKTVMKDVERQFLTNMLFINVNIKRGAFTDKMLKWGYQVIKGVFADDNYFDRLTYDTDYYIDCVTKIAGNKTWEDFVQREVEKEVSIEQAKALSIGVRFKTLHSSKGLESKNVYLLDYDVTAMPNQKKFTRYMDGGYVQEACELIRDERCLAFVGITRAKEKLYLVYNTMPSKFDLCQMGENYFSSVDNNYIQDFRTSIIVGNNTVEANINE